MPYAKQQLANISQYTGITPAWWLNHLSQNPSYVQKIAGHTNTLTPSELDIIKNNIFLRPEESMLETGKSLS